VFLLKMDFRSSLIFVRASSKLGLVYDTSQNAKAAAALGRELTAVTQRGRRRSSLVFVRLLCSQPLLMAAWQSACQHQVSKSTDGERCPKTPRDAVCSGTCHLSIDKRYGRHPDPPAKYIPRPTLADRKRCRIFEDSRQRSLQGCLSF
jgi:hypothetical protein